MQKSFVTRQQFLAALAEHSNIDYEKTFNCRELAFVTKDGQEYWAPSWNVYIQQLIEFADAQIVPEGCHKYPRTYIILFKDEKAKDVEEVSTEKVETPEESEEAVKPVRKGRKTTK